MTAGAEGAALEGDVLGDLVVLLGRVAADEDLARERDVAEGQLLRAEQPDAVDDGERLRALAGAARRALDDQRLVARLGVLEGRVVAGPEVDRVAAVGERDGLVD